jgi:hypothetical protein
MGKLQVAKLLVRIAAARAKQESINWLERFYRWFWFHTEIWIVNKLDRRPYTFIFRDWIYTHAKAFLAIIGVWYAGLITLEAFHYGWVALALGILSSLLIAHLVWGSKWIQGEQEEPQFLGRVKGYGQSQQA